MLSDGNPFTNEQIKLWQGEVAVALRRFNFNKWLIERPIHLDFGYKLSCANCILAVYLSEVVPHLDCKVTGSSVKCTPPHASVLNLDWYLPIFYLGDPNGNSPEMPTWAMRFIRKIDAMGTCTKISKSEALDALIAIDEP
jgi:hypothetical protein